MAALSTVSHCYRHNIKMTGTTLLFVALQLYHSSGHLKEEHISQTKVQEVEYCPCNNYRTLEAYGKSKSLSCSASTPGLYVHYIHFVFFKLFKFHCYTLDSELKLRRLYQKNNLSLQWRFKGVWSSCCTISSCIHDHLDTMPLSEPNID